MVVAGALRESWGAGACVREREKKRLSARGARDGAWRGPFPLGTVRRGEAFSDEAGLLVGGRGLGLGLNVWREEEAWGFL